MTAVPVRRSLVDVVLGSVDEDQRRSAALLMWPLFFVATTRFAYGVDSWIHGSPVMTQLAGRSFSYGWSSFSFLAALLSILGLTLTIRYGRPNLELLGSALCCALSIGFAFAVVWNSGRDGSSLVAQWQPLGLGLVAGWRAHRIAIVHRPPARRRRR